LVRDLNCHLIIIDVKFTFLIIRNEVYQKSIFLCDMIKTLKFLTAAILLCSSIFLTSISAQELDFSNIPAEVNFSEKLRLWDGFGVNYVETSQTFDYDEWPQDYGGFSFLDPESRDEIIELIFGDDGLQPDLVKMFLDPLHLKEEGGTFDHETTTANMRYFVKKGNEMSQARGQNLSIVTTLYGPPGFMTLQRNIRGRDLDPDYRDQLADYMVNWVQFLDEHENLPVKYISLHNEGESWLRWPLDGDLADIDATGHDYNMFWSPELMSDMIIRTRNALDQKGLNHVGVTPGETTNWYRFGAWGYGTELSRNREALEAMSIITSHGFYVGDIEARRWFGPHSNRGTEELRSITPGLHAWCTSTAWDVKNDELIVDNRVRRRYIVNAHFALEVHGNIYEAKVNGLIPWAFIQTASQWIRPDPNPGSAIRVYDDGTWEIRKGYYYYKQLTRAGRQGMHVVNTSSMDSQINVIGFSGEGTKHPDSFVLANTGRENMTVKFRVIDSNHEQFQAYRTSGEDIYEYTETALYLDDDDNDNYRDMGTFTLDGEYLIYNAPANSVTTFSGL